MVTALEEAANQQSQMQFDLAVRNQEIYGRLTNWRSDKLSDMEHKNKVLRGYYKIQGFLLKSY